MENEIETILKRHFLNRSPSYNPLDELDAATQAIFNLIERQPVDKVRAMAALVSHHPRGTFDIYSVPDIADRFTVWHTGKFACDCSLEKTMCDHIQAVEYHLATAQEVAELMKGEK